MSAPLQTVWDALAARECRPHGREHDFRARCPAHNGGNRESLHVKVGADGRALVHCFAHGCTVEQIVAALGLSIQDLFPDGHFRARRVPAPPVRRSDFSGSAGAVANTLHALQQLGERWEVLVSTDCPYCHTQGAWLTADSTGYVNVDCIEGCTEDNYVGALLGRLQETKR